jgi:hypothetical protein
VGAEGQNSNPRLSLDERIIGLFSRGLSDPQFRQALKDLHATLDEST